MIIEEGDYRIICSEKFAEDLDKALKDFTKDKMSKAADEGAVAISGKDHKSQLKQLQTDIEVLDHKIKQFVNHLRYTRKYKTRAIKKAITRQFGKQINEIDARSNNLEIKQKEQVLPSTDSSNESLQGQATVS